MSPQVGASSLLAMLPHSPSHYLSIVEFNYGYMQSPSSVQPGVGIAQSEQNFSYDDFDGVLLDAQALNELCLGM
jgi:hypothetical protein